MTNNNVFKLLRAVSNLLEHDYDGYANGIPDNILEPLREAYKEYYSNETFEETAKRVVEKRRPVLDRLEMRDLVIGFLQTAVTKTAGEDSSYYERSEKYDSVVEAFRNEGLDCDRLSEIYTAGKWEVIWDFIDTFGLSDDREILSLLK